MGFGFDRSIAVGLGVVAALIVGNASLSYQNTRQLSADAAGVVRTHEVLDALGDLLSAVKDAETGQRGFLVTGDEAYLEFYHPALGAAPDRVARLERLTADNPAQQARLVRVRELVAGKLLEIQKPVVIARAGDLPAARERLKAGDGKRLMDDLRAAVAEMDAHERDLLAAREQSSARAYTTAVTTGLIAAAAGLGAVALFVGLLRRFVATRARAAAAVHEQRELLRATLASIGDGVIATDPLGLVTFLNPVAQELTGWTPVTAVGRPLGAVFHVVNEDTRREVENPALRALRDGQIVGLANHTVLIGRDGAERPIDDSAAPIRDRRGVVSGAVLVFRDVGERRANERAAEERARLAAFGRDVGLALTRAAALPDALGHCAAAMVEHLGAAFARVWVLPDGGDTLELVASAGLYTHTDGPHARVPVGMYKIGRIAAHKTPRLTNDVANDSEVSDPEWATREGMVAFAGYPLLVDDRVVGVVAMFSRQRLTVGVLEAVAAVADGVAVGIARRRAEERAAADREWLRTTLASIGDGVIATDAGGRVALLNPAAEALTGWPREEAAGRPLAEVFRIVHETTREAAQNPAERALRDGVAVALANHTVLLNRDGSETPIADSAAPIRDRAGIVLGAVLVFRGVADERRAQRELESRVRERTAELDAANASLRVEVQERERAERAAEARARQQAAVAEFGRRGLAGADVDALMAGAAGVVAATLAVPFARVVEAAPGGAFRVRAGVGWEPELVGHEVGPDEAPLIDHALRAAEPVVFDDWQAEARFHRPGVLAARGVTSSVVAPIPGPGDHPLGVLAVDATAARAFSADDRTFVQAMAAILAAAVARRVAEDAAGVATVELRRSNAELEKFAYIASHDLQEPLRKIRAFGDRLRDKFRPQLGDQGQDYLDRMLSSAGRMSRLIDDLLTFSRVATHAHPFEPVDLTAITRDATADLENRANLTGGRIEVGDLPAANADPTQMRQLMQNLIGNALKFHRPGVPPVVKVTGRLVGAAACEIRVEDNGIGFDEKYLDRIFEVFQRLHGRDDYEGTGIGLAICKKIVDRHGGTLTAHSRPGEGAAFVVTLPVPPAKAD